jgi:hypothetical protein
VRFENKKCYLPIGKNALAFYSAGVVVVITEVAGLAPGIGMLMHRCDAKMSLLLKNKIICQNSCWFGYL